MMGRILSYTVRLCVCLVFSALHNAQRVGFRPHPEFNPEVSPAFPIPKPAPPEPHGAHLDASFDGSQLQPFLDPNQYDDVATLQPLLLSLASDMSTLQSQVTQEETSVDLATLTVPTGAAEIGCSIYSAYQTRCKVGKVPPPMMIVPGLTYTFATSDVFAACACYSSTYWVPGLYDNAVWACNQISSDSNDFTASVTTSNGSPAGFCEYNNPRGAAFAYGVATTTTAAATTSMPATAPVSTAAAPASPTAIGSAATCKSKGLFWEKGISRALTVTVAIVFALA